MRKNREKQRSRKAEKHRSRKAKKQRNKKNISKKDNTRKTYIIYPSISCGHQVALTDKYLLDLPWLARLQLFGHRCAVDFGPDLLRVSDTESPALQHPLFATPPGSLFFECKTPIRQNETTRSWILWQAIKIYQILLAKEMFVPVVPVVLLPIAHFAMRVLSIGMCGCSTTLRCGNLMFAPVHRGMV